MKHLKMVPFLLVMVAIFLLQLFENNFQYVQEILVLESNALLSSQHVLADESTYYSWKRLQTPHDHFRIFGILEETPTQRIIAYYSTDYLTDKIPISNGLFFSTANSKEAIIGDNIITNVINGVEYFKYNNTNYPVIGKLGISDDSPLKNFILINDSVLLDFLNIELIFDGPDISKISWLKGSPMENKGVERWFNISFFSKWINLTTILVIAFSSVLASYFYTIATKETRCAKFQIGVPIKSIFKIDIITLTTIALIMGISAILINKLNILKISMFSMVLSYILLYIGLIATHIFLAKYQIIKERFE